MAPRLVMRQPAGVVLRLNAANEQVTGVLERVDGGTVHRTGPARALPLSAITDAWLQRRSTGSGGKVGAIVGATGARRCSDLPRWERLTETSAPATVVAPDERRHAG